MQPHIGDGRAEWEEPAWDDGVVRDRKADPQTSPRISDTPRSSESRPELDGVGSPRVTDTLRNNGSKLDAVAEEHERLTSLLEKCTKELESELRRGLQQHRLAMDDMISHTLDSFRKEASRRCSPEHRGRSSHDSQQLGPIEPVVRDVLAPEGDQARPEPRAFATRRDLEAELPPAPMSIKDYFSQAVRSRMTLINGSTEENEEDDRSLTRPTMMGLMRVPPRLTAGYSVGLRMLYPSSFIHGTVFNFLSAALIVSNAAFIGYQTHVGIEHQFKAIDSNSVSDLNWGTAEVLFLSFFTWELLLRIGTDRLAFIKGVEWRWNLFDSIIVGLSLVETVASSILSGVGLNFPFLRLVRVVRVLRVLKVLHMIPFFKRLGLMMTSVAASLSALAPAFVLLILVIYMFGICMMQGVITHLETNKVKAKEAWLTTLEIRFGTIHDTMQTMFMSITGGISWAEVLDGFNKMDGFYHLVYMFYVGFVQICVLNIVTGVFVDTVHQMYQPERDEMIERETSKRKAMLQNLKNLLEEADSDGSGTITWEEFDQFTQNPHIKMYLSAHEIDITQAHEIFDLIDRNREGEVMIDDFVLSFIEFKGAAKGTDVVILRNDVSKILSTLTPFIQESAKSTAELKRMLAQTQCGMPIDMYDTEQVVGPMRVGKGSFVPGRGKGGKGALV
mmetsp:Transcript_66066/g.204482  ORF Transcript_66066/g.204482 Transcript_66066/m.204482 type:complete len:673 (-) Transcript_66066:58-2076(-)